MSQHLHFSGVNFAFLLDGVLFSSSELWLSSKIEGSISKGEQRLRDITAISVMKFIIMWHFSFHTDENIVLPFEHSCRHVPLYFISQHPCSILHKYKSIWIMTIWHDNASRYIILQKETTHHWNETPNTHNIMSFLLMRRGILWYIIAHVVFVLFFGTSVIIVSFCIEGGQPEMQNDTIMTRVPKTAQPYEIFGY